MIKSWLNQGKIIWRIRVEMEKFDKILMGLLLLGNCGTYHKSEAEFKQNSMNLTIDEV